MVIHFLRLWLKVHFGTFEYLKPIKEETHIAQDDRWYNDTVDYQILKLFLN